jgi:hypothetical protein
MACNCCNCQTTRRLQDLEREVAGLRAVESYLRWDLAQVRAHRDRLVESHRELRLEIDRLERTGRSGGRVPVLYPDLESK